MSTAVSQEAAGIRPSRKAGRRSVADYIRLPRRATISVLLGIGVLALLAVITVVAAALTR